MKKSLIIGLSVLLLAIVSCRSHQKAPATDVTLVDSVLVSTPETVSASLDTVTSIIETPSIVLPPFPDTIFPSAEKLLFVVDTFQTDISGMMSDLSDKYDGSNGIFTFRGSQTRNPNFSGRIHGDLIDIHTEWVFAT